MRLKIFFTPLIFIVVIVVAIVFIWPAAKDILAKRQALVKSNNELNLIIEKKNNVEVLKGMLDKNKDKEDFILNYLSYSRNDDKIVDGINYIATDSGVNLINLSVEEVKDVAIAGQGSEGLSAVSESTGTGSSAEDVLVLKPTVKYFSVKTDISGKYQNIKMFIEQMNKMGILNKINSLNISKASSSDGQVDANNDVLLANVEFRFGYMPQIHEQYGSSSEVFSKNNLDFSSYSKIVNLITKIIPALDDGQKGKSNPFLP